MHCASRSSFISIFPFGRATVAKIILLGAFFSLAGLYVAVWLEVPLSYILFGLIGKVVLGGMGAGVLVAWRRRRMRARNRFPSGE